MMSQILLLVCLSMVMLHGIPGENVTFLHKTHILPVLSVAEPI